jgi:hypothetical protein
MHQLAEQIYDFICIRYGVQETIVGNGYAKVLVEIFLVILQINDDTL